jgi:hypothetical protein
MKLKGHKKPELKDVQKLEQSKIYKKNKLLKLQNQCKFYEKDFHSDEIVTIPLDVYSITFAANITNQSPIHFNFCLKQCFMVFMIQTIIAYIYCMDENFKDLDNF